MESWIIFDHRWEASAKRLGRGLSELEVSVTKRMRLWGLQRDYIYSFLSEPGRVLSPACVDEVASGKIGPEVPPATEAVVREYVASRSSAASLATSTDPQSPVSLWRIHQVLEGTKTQQLQFEFEEGYSTEFKQVFQNSDDAIAKYMKAMCAFANAEGGYMFFGIADSGTYSSIDIDKFNQFDWNAFDQKLQAMFDPYIKWQRRVATLPDDALLLGGAGRAFDTTLLKRIAKKAHVPEEQLIWLDRIGEESGNPAQVGVIYVYPAPVRVTCVRTHKKTLRAGESYVRFRGRNIGVPEDKDVPASLRANAKNADSARAERMLKELDERIRRSATSNDSGDHQRELF